MTQRQFSDRLGRFDFSVSIHDESLQSAIRHDEAEAVMKSALLLALAVLKQSDDWPNHAMHSMSTFMQDMRSTIGH